MLNWLFPRPPIDPVEKAWTETRMQWIAEQFGLPRLLATQVVPAHDLVSVDYDGTLENAREILTRMCKPLATVPAQFSLEVVAAHCASEPEPVQSKDVIRIEDQQLRNPYSVAATMAHELALRQLPLHSLAGVMTGQVSWLADLTAVFMGWGVVIGHVSVDALAGAHRCGCRPGQPSGLLPARMLGYALALFAHVRGEVRPAWESSLQPDTAAVFKRSESYLRRTSDTLFTLESAGRTSGKRPTDELLHQLRTGSRSARVAALWELRDSSHAATAAEPVAKYLHHSPAAIREEAARTLAQYGPAGKCAMPSLIDLLHDRAYSIRAAAAHALGMLGTDSTEALAQLAPLLVDPDRHVVFEVAKAVENFGERGAEVLPSLLRALRGAVIRCDHELIDTLTHTLYALDPDPTNRVLEFFEDDLELREQVVHIIVDALEDHGEGKIA